MMNRSIRIVLAAVGLMGTGSASCLTYDDGLAHVVDSTINDFIHVFDGPGGTTTSVTFNTGANVTGNDSFDTSVYVAEGSLATFNDGAIAQDLDVDDDAVVTIFGGQLNDDIYTYARAQVFFYGGTLDDDLFAFDDSVVTIDGGTLNNHLIVEDNATVYVYSGSVDDDVEVGYGGTAFLIGGSFGEDIESYDGGTIDISGGTLAANGLGALDYGLGVDDDGTIILRGYSFSVNGSPAGPGEIAAVDGTISGMLADGSTFTDIPFDRNPGGGLSRGVIELVIVPEPASAGLLAVGGLLMIRRRR